MFFPCTSEENISITAPAGRYLEKPTILFCNPNALLYQQMVTSSNANWLNFFIKRGINVMCWNYRGYGKSRLGMSEYLNPYMCKVDSEKVLEFMLNKLKLKGKIGVYGRSIGGIASCHLANKYPDIISTMIIDRTFSELESLSTYKLVGYPTKWIFRGISCHWKT